MQEPFQTESSAVVGPLSQYSQTIHIFNLVFLSTSAYFDKADQSSGKEVKNVMEV